MPRLRRDPGYEGGNRYLRVELWPGGAYRAGVLCQVRDATQAAVVGRRRAETPRMGTARRPDQSVPHQFRDRRYLKDLSQHSHFWVRTTTVPFATLLPAAGVCLSTIGVVGDPSSGQARHGPSTLESIPARPPSARLRPGIEAGLRRWA